MYSRILTAMGGSLLALGAATASMPAAQAISLSATSGGSAVQVGYGAGRTVLPWTHTAGATISQVADDDDDESCFSNLEDDSGAAYLSQNFDTQYDAYDSAAADDFTLEEDCWVESVDVPGVYFNGPGPAASETVTFYLDAGGVPAAVVNTQTVDGYDATGTGSFELPLQPFTLAQGTHYWVSIQINMALQPGGEWGWEASDNQVGDPAVWQNPGDGIGTGCTTWNNIEGCIAAVGPDLLFGLSGYSGPFSETFAGAAAQIQAGPSSGSATLPPPRTPRCPPTNPDGSYTFETGASSQPVRSQDFREDVAVQTRVVCTGEHMRIEPWVQVRDPNTGEVVAYPLQVVIGPKDTVRMTLTSRGKKTVGRIINLTTGASDKLAVKLSAPLKSYYFGLTALDPEGRPYDPADFGVQKFTKVKVGKTLIDRLDPTRFVLVDGEGGPLVGPGPIDTGHFDLITYTE